MSKINQNLSDHENGVAGTRHALTEIDSATLDNSVSTPAIAVGATDLNTRLLQIVEGLAKAAVGSTASAWATAVNGLAATANLANIDAILGSSTTAAGARTALGVPPLAGTGATGTWPISVTGNAATATNVAATGITGTVLAAQIDSAIARTANVPTNAGAGATGTWGIAISGNAATATTAGTVTGTVAVANGGTGAITPAAAQTALGVPSATGTGASGTWGIGITGNAATATTATSATSAAAATDLAAGSILGVAKGGTGVNTLPANGAMIGNGTSAVTAVAPGTAGNVLISNGTAWTAGVVAVPDFSLTTKKLSDGAVIPYVPGTLHVSVNAMKKFDGAGNPVQWSGGDLDLSSYVPGSGTSVWVLVYLNATAAVYAAAGQASATPLKPQTIGGQTPLAYVLMYAGMTQITAADIYEWRTDFAAFAVGGGTGSGYSAVGHLHGQGGESFVAVSATDEGRVTTPNVPGMTVYVQPMRYSDTSAVVQQFPGGPSATIARPVSNPYLVAVGMSQAGSVTLNYGPEAASPVRGPFLNATDAPLAYILVRPASTRTVLNDDNTNALIIDARRTYTFSSPAASGVSGVSTGGTGQSSFATAGIVISPGGTAPLVTIPGAASATVGMAVTPSVTPAGLDADGFQIGPVVIATTGTNITNYRSMHLLSPTKTGTGTVANMYGVYTEGPTIAGTTTTIADYIKTGTTGTIGVVIDTVAAPTGNLQEWRANGTVVGAVSAAGAIGQGGTASPNVAFFQSGTFASVSSSAWAFAQNTILKPSGAGGTAAFGVFANTGTIDTSATGGAVSAAYGVLVNPVNKTGAGTITNAYGLYVNSPTAGGTNYTAAFASGLTNGQTTYLDQGGRIKLVQAAPPTIAALAGAGTGATASVVGTDQAGYITLNTGTGPVAGNAQLATITFRNALAAVPNAIILTPCNPNASNLARAADVTIYRPSMGASAFNTMGGASALAASTTYEWFYWVVA